MIPKQFRDPAVGRQLRAWRKAKKLSRDEMGRALGYVNGQFIYNWENGISLVPLRSIKKTAKLFRIPDMKIRQLLFNYELNLLKKKYGVEIETRPKRKRKSVAPEKSPVTAEGELV